MEYRKITHEELTPELLHHFQRHQEITDVWRKEDGQWVIRACPRIIGNWGREQQEFICHCLRETLDEGGMVTGAFIDGALKGIVAVDASPLGSRGQYRAVLFLHVSRDCRGQGIGRGLFSIAKEFAKQLGAEKLYMSSQAAVESQAFYKAMGCAEAEEYSPVYAEKNPNDCQIECGVS